MNKQPHHSEDLSLINKVLAGETACFKDLMERYEKPLLGYLNNRCDAAHTIDDLYQETCIATYRNLGQYKPEYPFGSWVFGIARNKVNQFFRKVTPMIYETADQVDPVSPDQTLSAQERSIIFWQEARKCLSEEQLTILSLHYQQEMPVKRIALTLELSESKVKIDLFRSRKKLGQSKTLSALANETHSQNLEPRTIASR